MENQKLDEIIDRALDIREKIDTVIQQSELIGVDKEIKKLLYILRNQDKHGSDDILYAAFKLGELTGKMLQSIKIAKCTKILI